MNSAMMTIRQMIARCLGEQAERTGEHRLSPEDLELQPLSADGSQRRFFRVFRDGVSCGMAVLPAGQGARERQEARSMRAIGVHLYRAGVPVPQIYGADDVSGLVVYQDFGDCRLHDLALRDRSAALNRYPELIRIMVQMQTAGADGFNPGWCLDEPFYDVDVMIEREARYFMTAFWRDLLFNDEVPGLYTEFERLARYASELFEPVFLHRDFQSRNIMVHREGLGIIDFQAGRLGPPGYDLASMLIDPYMALSDAQQQELFELYCEEIERYGVVSTDLVKRCYPLLAVQRNLQIIGAFAFLSGNRRKTFFRPFLMPSLIMLNNRLTDSVFDDFPILRSTVAAALTGYRRVCAGGQSQRSATDNT